MIVLVDNAGVVVVTGGQVGQGMVTVSIDEVCELVMVVGGHVGQGLVTTSVDGTGFVMVIEGQVGQGFVTTVS